MSLYKPKAVYAASERNAEYSLVFDLSVKLGFAKKCPFYLT